MAVRKTHYAVKLSRNTAFEYIHSIIYISFKLKSQSNVVISIINSPFSNIAREKNE